MSVRTSETHPLIINEVKLPGCDGVIGITFCPGKKDRHSMTGVWYRDLETDMKSIKAWGASCLLTLIEDHEFNLLCVQKLPECAREHGITWYHLPILDVSIPDDRFQDRWPGIYRRLMNVLKNGGRIVVHCRGGLGRAGLVAALLLVEAKVPAKDAISNVREVRPGAVETIQQEEYIKEYKTVEPLAKSL